MSEIGSNTSDTSGASGGGLPDIWMVRTHTNDILGPFKKSEIIAQISAGALSPDDEVCQANHYWIYLDEREEVMKQLGVEVHRTPVLGEDDEVTATETLAQDVRSSSEEPAQDSAEVGPDGTRSTIRPSYRGPRPIREKEPPFAKVELPFFIRLVISALMVIMGSLFAWLIHLLHG